MQMFFGNINTNLINIQSLDTVYLMWHFCYYAITITSNSSVQCMEEVRTTAWIKLTVSSTYTVWIGKHMDCSLRRLEWFNTKYRCVRDPYGKGGLLWVNSTHRCQLRTVGRGLLLYSQFNNSKMFHFSISLRLCSWGQISDLPFHITNLVLRHHKFGTSFLIYLIRYTVFIPYTVRS